MIVSDELALSQHFRSTPARCTHTDMKTSFPSIKSNVAKMVRDPASLSPLIQLLESRFHSGWNSLQS